MVWRSLLFAGCLLLAIVGARADLPPAKAYGSLPAAENPQLSPDGKSVAYIAPANGRRCLQIVDLTILRKSEICVDPSELSWFRWKSDSKLVFGVYDTPKNPQTDKRIKWSNLFSVDRDGSNQKELIPHKQRGWIDFQTDFLLDLLPEDPGHILSVIKDPGLKAIRVDIQTGTTEDVTPSMDARILGTDGHGHIVFALVPRMNKLKWYYRQDEQSDFDRIPSDDAFGNSGYTPVAVSDQPNVIYVKSSYETGRQAIYLLDVRSGQILSRYAARPDVDIGGIIQYRGHVVGYQFTVDERQQVFTDAPWKHDQEVIQRSLPNMHVMLLDRTSDGKSVLAQIDGGNRPPKIYLLARTPGRPTHLDPILETYPAVPESALASVTAMTYTARDGLLLHAYLTMPSQAKAGPVPFVILPHGGPYARDFEKFDYLAQFLASRGYGVIQPNFRGSTGYGYVFAATGLQEWGRKMQDDVTDATRWAVQKGFADPKRICIVGASYGGYAALMGAIREPDLYRCVASIAGVTDLTTFASPGNVASTAEPIFNGDSSLMVENSPAQNPERVKIPVLLLHGTRDLNVPVEQSEHLERVLRGLGKQVEAHYFDDDHYFLHETDRIALLTNLEGFLDRNIGSGSVH